VAQTDSIVDRLSNYFDRQIGLYDEMLKSYETLSTDLEADELESLGDRQEAFTRRANQLEEELQLLSREWHAATNVTDAEREHIRGLARHAEEMARRLESISQTAAGQTRTRMRAVKDELDSLRRGQQTMTKYRSEDGDSGYLDTKA